jgi:2,4-dienoyl-CoA reductase-like NADH-dependent reductase (Old Yellow Enzyme family)
MPQIWHEGLIRIPRPETRARLPEPDEPSVSPSGLDVEPYAWARTLEHAEIEQLIAAYVEAGVNAKEMGCDGVEIHGAHGYLIDAFLRAETNRRTDYWGGSLENRTRFAVEIVKGIRQQVGPDFPIVFRFSQWTLRDYNHRLVDNPKELEMVLRPLADAGVTIFHASTRRFWDPAFEGSERTLSGWAKDVTGLPSIAVGSVGLALDMRDKGLLADITIGGSMDRLEQAFAEDEFDLIGVGRAVLANADWPNRIRDGVRDGFAPWTADTLVGAVLAAKR